MVTGKKILVTGAGGFIGNALAVHLAVQGHQVTGVDVDYPMGVSRPPFDAHAGDVRDVAKMEELLKGVDVVFHLASAHLKTSLDESEYWSVNVTGVRDLVRSAHSRDVERFVHVSSVGVYGNLTSWPAHEETACNPQSVYGRTKLAGERAVQEFCEETAFPAIILRPAWVFGATCPRTRKIYRSLLKRTFVMIGRGDNLRHPLYVTDLLEEFDRLLTIDFTAGDVYILGGERALTTRELVDSFCDVLHLKPPPIRVPYWMGATVAGAVEAGFRIINQEPPISRRTLEFFDTNNAFDISKAKRDLGFTPRFTFEEGLSDCRQALEASA